MTLFTDCGYTEDTEFELIEDTCDFTKGETVVLDWDDASINPRFKCKRGENLGNRGYLFLPGHKDSVLKVIGPEKELTPFQKLGYKPEDTFVLTADDGGLTLGTKVTLSEDDGTMVPYFVKEGDSDVYAISLDNLERVSYKTDKKLTPFEEAGYTGDMTFITIRSSYLYEKGDILTFNEDDGSSAPSFIKVCNGEKIFAFVDDLAIYEEACVSEGKESSITVEFVSSVTEYSVYDVDETFLGRITNDGSELFDFETFDGLRISPKTLREIADKVDELNGR